MIFYRIMAKKPKLNIRGFGFLVIMDITLDNLTKYGNITLKFVGRYFYFPKNRAILVQKLWGEKKLTKSVFGYFKTKKNKVPMAIQLEGGGKTLMAWPLVEEFFCGFPKSISATTPHFGCFFVPEMGSFNFKFKN